MANYICFYVPLAKIFGYFVSIVIPRVAGFIILSLKGLRRDEISCGVYGHIYLFIYL